MFENNVCLYNRNNLEGSLLVILWCEAWCDLSAVYEPCKLFDYGTYNSGEDLTDSFTIRPYFNGVGLTT